MSEYTPRKVLLAQRAAQMRHTPDQTPVAVPAGMQQPPTTEERVRALIRQELSQAAQANDMGTFEDEDDFEPDADDLELLSDFQIRLMVDEVPDSNTVLDSPAAGEAAPGEAQPALASETPEAETPTETHV